MDTVRAFILVAVILIASPSANAESKAQNPEDMIRMYQAQKEAQRIDEDFALPKTVETAKNRASLGDRKAPITIVEYSDFQCPYCKNGAENVETIRKKYGKKIFFVFKHLPLNFHALAMPAAKYFEAIAIQNGKKAYEFHDALFKNQNEFVAGGEKWMEERAKKLGVNMTKLKQDLASEEVKKRIDGDMAQARDLGFSGTPGYLVAGVRLAGAYPVEQFTAIIDRRLEDAKPKKKK